MFLEHSHFKSLHFRTQFYFNIMVYHITLVESWHGGESGDQDCEEASPDRTHRDQAQQGQWQHQEFVSNSNIYIP